MLRTEYRTSRMLVFVRVGTSFFAYLPLFVWGSLARPWIAVCAAVAASCEAALFAVWVQGTRTLRDRRLVTVDVLFCLALMLAGTRAAAPHMRNEVATELIPTALAGAAIVGFGFAFGVVQVMAVAASWPAGCWRCCPTSPSSSFPTCSRSPSRTWCPRCPCASSGRWR